MPPIALAPLEIVRIEINDNAANYEIRRSRRLSAVTLRTQLKQSDYSILTLHTPVMSSPNDQLRNGDLRRLGIPVSDIIIEPLARRRLYPAWKHSFRA